MLLEGRVLTLSSSAAPDTDEKLNPTASGRSSQTVNLRKQNEMGIVAYLEQE